MMYIILLFYKHSAGRHFKAAPTCNEALKHRTLPRNSNMNRQTQTPIPNAKDKVIHCGLTLHLVKN